MSFLIDPSLKRRHIQGMTKHFHNAFSAAIAVVVVFAVTLASTVTAEAKIFDPETFTLKNGMQVVVISNSRAPVVRQMVWYKVGSADEGAGESGIAHLLEHLMFKGTKTTESGEFSKKIARNGGQENAFTSYDYTAYFQTIARDRLEMVMKYEANRMTNLVITADEVVPERDVVLEERRSRVDNNPRAQLGEQVNATLFTNYPYRRPIIGWEHEIAALDLDRILAFYRKYYAPNNAVLIVEGDVTVEQIKPLAEKYYGVIPRGPDIKRERTIEPPARANKRVELKHERVTQERWNRSYLAPSYSYGEGQHRYALQILTEILGGGASSRLHKRLVLDDKIALSAGSFYSPDALGPATFFFYVSPKPGTDMSKIDPAVDEELARLINQGVTKKEVDDAIERLQNHAAFARDNFGTAARVFGVALTSGGSIEEVESWPARIGEVTPEAVIEAAKHVFEGAFHVTSELLPKPQS